MAANESKGPAILFFGTWFALGSGDNKVLSDHAFELSLYLMLAGWLAIKMLGHATARLGKRAWYLILQLAVWYVFFLWLVPAAPVTKIVFLWGLATPLGFAGAGARRLYERFAHLRDAMNSAPAPALALACTIGAVWSWLDGSGFWTGLFVTLICCLFASIPFYFGWHLAEPLPRGDRDARFGTGDSYRKAGMSDVR
jgi:hypothetical protein